MTLLSPIVKAARRGIWSGGSEVCVPIWQPNGINQQLSVSIPVSIGTTISFTLVVSDVKDTTDTIFDTAERVRVRLLSSGVWDVANGSLFVDGVATPGNSALPPLGSVVNCVFMSSVVTNLMYIGSFLGSGVFSSQSIYNLSIDGGAIYNYPLDDGFTNNPTARNLGSGADGAFVNNDAGAWGERCE